MKTDSDAPRRGLMGSDRARIQLVQMAGSLRARVAHNSAFGVITLFVVIGIVLWTMHAIGSAYKLPHDGSYYLAFMRSLATDGRLLDISSAPPGGVLTPQNGIVFWGAGLMLAFGDHWQAIHLLLLAGLWTWAAWEIGVLANSLFRSRLLVLLLPAAAMLQLDYAIQATIPINETVYVPALYAVTARLMNGCLQHDRENLFSRGRWPALGVVLFLIVGSLFRSQHVIFLVALCAVYLWRWRALAPIVLGLSAASVSLLLVHAYLTWTPLQGQLTKSYTQLFQGNGSLQQITYVLQSLGFYTYANVLAGYDSVITILSAGIGSLLFGFGMIRVFRCSRTLFVFVALFVGISIFFYLNIKFHQSRYYLPTNLIVLIVACLGVQRLVGDRWLPKLVGIGAAAAVVAMGTAVGLYFVSYHSGVGVNYGKQRNFYNLLLIDVYERFGERFDPSRYLLYAREYRHTYWMLGQPGCRDNAPEICRAARILPAGAPIVFIGHRSELDMIRAFHSVETLVGGEEGFGAWRVEEWPDRPPE